jgi:hypothetical protein
MPAVVIFAVTMFVAATTFAPQSAAQNIPGCAMPPGYERAQPPRLSAAQTQLRERPSVLIDSLRRGFDDGNPRSCSNAGVLTLVINESDTAPTEVYEFDVAEGSLPQGMLPSGYVEPIDISSGRQGFRFSWLDLREGSDTLASIDAVLSITRVSYAGERSEPLLVPIMDAGGVAARSTSPLWNSTIVWIGVALVLLVFIGMRMKLFSSSGRRQDDLEAIQARLRTLADEKRGQRGADKSE